jgi:menaquinone reductase, multiheme cytochrome c subunit
MDSKPLMNFPKWSNKAALGILLALVLAPLYLGIVLGYGANPTTLNVGYQPVQPVPYSHALHPGKLGIDCRYCHNTVETAGMAAIPPTEVCMNCHKGIMASSNRLAEVRRSYAEGTPIRWIKVHDLPDYVYFNHSAHVNVGVGCAECHGPVHQMDVVRTVQNLSMSWCIECHRAPERYLRPRDQVTNMNWVPPGGGSLAAREELGRELAAKYHINANTDCVTCHR